VTSEILSTTETTERTGKQPEGNASEGIDGLGGPNKVSKKEVSPSVSTRTDSWSHPWEKD